MKRGDIVLVAVRGPYSGKPRPAVVVQSDLFNATHASVTLCPLTSHLLDAPLLRPDVPSTERTGISRPSQAMVDKVFSAPIANVRVAVGSLDAATMQRVDDALRRWLDL